MRARLALSAVLLFALLGTPALAQEADPTPPPADVAIPAPEATPVPVPEATPVPVPEATPVPVPEATPVPVPEATPVPAPEATPTPAPIPQDAAVAGQVEVSDPHRTLGPGAAMGLAVALNELGAEGYFVDCVTATGVESLDARARRHFDERRLGPSQAMIVLCAPAKRVGLALGQSYLDAGLEGQNLENRIAVGFQPLMEKNDAIGAVVELARQLKVSRAKGSGGVGLAFWLWLIAIGAGAVGATYASRAHRARLSRREELRYRMTVLTGQLANLKATAAELPGAWSPPFVAEGEALTKGLAAARVDFQAGRHAEADLGILELEQRVLLAEAGVAAVGSANGVASPAQVPAYLASALATARRWQELRTLVSFLEAHGTSAVAAQVARKRLVEVRALIVAAPPQPEAAAEGLAALYGQLEQLRGKSLVVRAAPVGEARPVGEVWDLTRMVFAAAEMERPVP